MAAEALLVIGQTSHPILEAFSDQIDNIVLLAKRVRQHFQRFHVYGAEFVRLSFGDLFIRLHDTNAAVARIQYGIDLGADDFNLMRGLRAFLLDWVQGLQNSFQRR